jgi:hypothetical protein
MKITIVVDQNIGTWTVIDVFRNEAFCPPSVEKALNIGIP